MSNPKQPFILTADEVKYIKEINEGNFGIAYLFEYTGKNNDHKRFCQPYTDSQNITHYFFVAKFPKAGAEADFTHEQTIVDQLAAQALDEKVPHNLAHSAELATIPEEISVSGKQFIFSQLEAVTFHEVEQKDGSVEIQPLSGDVHNIFLSMQGSLQHKLSRKAKLSAKDSALASAFQVDLDITMMQIIVSIYQSIKYIHNKNILHGDLALRNILLGKAYTANGAPVENDNDIAISITSKLSDFGMSCTVEEAKEIHHDEFDLFIANEERARTQQSSIASDLYAFRIILFEIFNELLANPKVPYQYRFDMDQILSWDTNLYQNGKYQPGMSRREIVQALIAQQVPDKDKSAMKHYIDNMKNLFLNPEKNEVKNIRGIDQEMTTTGTRADTTILLNSFEQYIVNVHNAYIYPNQDPREQDQILFQQSVDKFIEQTLTRKLAYYRTLVDTASPIIFSKNFLISIQRLLALPYTDNLLTDQPEIKALLMELKNFSLDDENIKRNSSAIRTKFGLLLELSKEKQITQSDEIPAEQIAVWEKYKALREKAEKYTNTKKRFYHKKVFTDIDHATALGLFKTIIKTEGHYKQKETLDDLFSIWKNINLPSSKYIASIWGQIENNVSALPLEKFLIQRLHISEHLQNEYHAKYQGKIKINDDQLKMLRNLIANLQETKKVFESVSAKHSNKRIMINAAFQGATIKKDSGKSLRNLNKTIKRYEKLAYKLENSFVKNQLAYFQEAAKTNSFNHEDYKIFLKQHGQIIENTRAFLNQAIWLNENISYTKTQSPITKPTSDPAEGISLKDRGRYGRAPFPERPRYGRLPSELNIIPTGEGSSDGESANRHAQEHIYTPISKEDIKVNESQKSIDEVKEPYKSDKDVEENKTKRRTIAFDQVIRNIKDSRRINDPLPDAVRVEPPSIATHPPVKAEVHKIDEAPLKELLDNLEKKLEETKKLLNKMSELMEGLNTSLQHQSTLPVNDKQLTAQPNKKDSMH